MRPIPQPQSVPPQQGGTECTQDFDIMIAIDTSTSIDANNFATVRDFVTELVAVFRNDNNDTRIGFILFAEQPELLQGLTSDSTEISNALERMVYVAGNSTNITDTLYMANDELLRDPREGTPRMLIILTDGNDTATTPGEVATAATIFNNNGNISIGITVGQSANLSRIDPDFVYPVDDFDQLSNQLAILAETTCRQVPIFTPIVDTTTPAIPPPIAPSDPNSDPLAGAGDAGGGTSNTTTTVAPDDSSNSDDVMDYLPFILIPLLLLLLIGGVFGLLSGRNRNRGGGAAPSGRGPKPPVDPTPRYTGPDYSNWERNIENQFPPVKSAPFASFHERTLVIGLGAAGADALQNIVGRIDDTNTADKVFYLHHHHRTRNENRDMPNRPLALLHIDMPNVYAEHEAPKTDHRWPEYLVDVLNIPSKPDLNNSSDQQQEWADMLGVYSTSTTNRQTAKTALYSAFRFGPDAGQIARVYAVMRDYLDNGFEEVFIVASPFDWVGANIAGDIAMLMRSTRAADRKLRIHTLLVLEESGEERLSTNRNNDIMRTAALHELGRLSTPSGFPVTTELGPDVSYTINDPKEAMINTLVLFPGPTAHQRLTSFLWGLLVHPTLFTTFTDRSSNLNPDLQYVPSVSVAMTRSMEWPLALLRDMLVCDLMLRVIGGRTVSHRTMHSIPCTEADINRELNVVRGEGLLPSIIYLIDNAACSTNSHLRDIRAMLETRRSYYTERRRTIVNQMSSRTRAQEDRRMAFRAEDWEDVELPKDIEHDVFSRIGWAARTSDRDLERGYIVRMLAAANGNTSREIVFNDSEELARYLDPIEEIARTLITNVVLSPTKANRVNELANQELRYRSDRQEWENQPAKWDDELVQFLSPTRLLPPYTFSFNAPQTWTRRPVEDLEINTEYDATMALQGVLHPRVPLDRFSILQTVLGNQDFVHVTEAIVWDVFKGDDDALKKVPVPLQSALTQRVEFWTFFEVWRIDGKEGAIEALKLGSTAMSMEEALKSFMQAAANNRGRVLDNATKYIDEYQDDRSENPVDEFADDFSSSEFDTYLRKAFTRLMEGGSRYFPPRTV